MGLHVLAAYALYGITVFLQPQASLPDVSWPTHAVITLPLGWTKSAENLVLLENDRPIVAQVETVAKWPDGSPKWLHAHALFRYIGGKPAKYSVVRRAAPAADLPKSPLTVSQDTDGIDIDTGAIKIRISRPFAGITVAECGGVPVIKGAGGPSLVDERGIAWHSMHDETAEIVVEQQGPAQVTVKATGWYQTAEKRTEPFCRFVTRITAFANSPIIKFDHATIFADDMRKHALAELSFKFSVPNTQGFASSTLSGSFDSSLSAIWFAQPSASRMVTLTQSGTDESQVRSIKDEQKQSPGWFGAKLADKQVVLLTKDFWHKCPKETKISPSGINYYAWPRHGELGEADDRATRPELVYKFQCFHVGKLLDSRLPSEYFTALQSQTDTTECKAEYARAANMSGVAIHNEFALAFLPSTAQIEGRAADDYFARLQQLYEIGPIARVSPTAIAESGVLGPVAALDRGFPAVQATVRDGMLGYAHSIDRYGDYGWAIYGNTHHDEFMNPAAAGVPGGRPSLHRVWSNNHYQHVSTSWRLNALSGDEKLLHWARTCTDYYASIGQVRYDAQKGRLDGKGARHEGSVVKFHVPGAFWHCKAFVPWGGRDYGMDANDADSGLIGHWPDPSGLLLAWLLDANRWAKDGYDLWLSSVQFPSGGTRREVNTTLVHAITAYEYQPSAKILAAIQGMAKGLSSVPIVQQQPGPLWEPTWLSRYHELFPKDDAFNKFLVDSADAVGVRFEAIWSLALSATAYRITKDEKYLRQHGGTLARAVREVFRDPAPDKRWDKYGFEPGPDRDGHFLLQWPRFYAALKEAKIESLDAPEEPGNYLCGVSRWNDKENVKTSGTKILVWRNQPSARLTVQAGGIAGGDIDATSLQLLSPASQVLLDVPRLPMSGGNGASTRVTRPSTWEVFVESYPFPRGEEGLYSVLIGSNAIGIFQPLTDQTECQILRRWTNQPTTDQAEYHAKLARGYLVPLTDAKIALKFSAVGSRDGSYVSISGSRGQRLLDRFLRAGDTAGINLNDSEMTRGPWLLDAFSDHSGYFRLVITADVSEPLMFGRRLEDIALIREKMGK